MTKKFELLCATTGQRDFSKLEEMGVAWDVLLANQAETFAYQERPCGGGTARMITTPGRGVGKNRNLLLTYADAEICLMADDDVTYAQDCRERVLEAFREVPDADVIIFGLEARCPSAERKPPVISRVRRLRAFSRNPYGGPRIAFRLESVRKANLWFTLLFGGGCRYPSGEDSAFLMDARKKGLRVYCYPYVVGQTDYTKSSWFSGFNESYYYGKGAYYRAFHRRSRRLWGLYCAARTARASRLGMKRALRWLDSGARGFDEGLSYAEWTEGQGT